MTHFMYYDARPCGMNGMYDTDTLLPLKGYYPFPMYNELYKIGSEAEVPAQTGNIYALAAASAEKCAVLLTNYTDDDTAPAAEVKLSLTGLPAGTWKISYRLLDAEHDCTLVREEKTTVSDVFSYVTLQLFGTVLATLEKE
jgi:hypothetical protein